MAKLEGVRILLSYATYRKFKVYQMDVKSAFLNGVLEEEVYIEQLEGFALEYGIDMVCKLKKALYGLKKAPRAWYERLHSYLISIGFMRTSDNSNLYLKTGQEGKHMIVEIFVDDIIFGGDDEMRRGFAEEIKKYFEMSMIGEIKFFIGLQVSQLKNVIFISQTKYIREILNTFGMEDSKPIGTPMVTGCKLSKNDEANEVNEILYRSMIGKLQYAVYSRLDIAQVADLVARFVANPKETHMVAVKRTFRYIKGTDEYGLWYPHKGNFNLSVFTDVDWAGNIDDRKSTSGDAFFLGDRIVSWTRKKQNCISQSIVEVEYVVVAINYTQAVCEEGKKTL